MRKVIIADTSTLIIYKKIDHLDLLQDIFDSITVTPEVAGEFGDLPSWIKIEEYQDQETFNLLHQGLGAGEASAIVLAIEQPNSILIIDERKGRRIAQSYEIEIIGALGILLLGKELKKIISVKSILDKIIATDFRISDKLVKIVLEQAGEYGS